MLPTHVLLGVVLALPWVLVVPELLTVAAIAGAIGGLIPDLDLYAGHRKTLHFPVGYTVGAAIVVPIAALAPSTVTLAIAAMSVGAASHCLGDILAGGLELRPWEARDERAVYDHFHGRWIRPRRVIRYDGSPEDVILSIGLAIPLLAVLDPPLVYLVVLLLGVGLVYGVLRRRLASIAPRIADSLPGQFHAHVPDRYLEDKGVAGRR